ncbi:MAG: right-handed parallel beta-helix repeat-containing protein, partial [Verrucomicrobiota bacterium]
DPRGLVPMADRKRRGRLLNIDGSDPAKNYSHHGYYADQRLVYAIGGRDIVLENSVGFRLHAMIETVGTHNVTSRGNRMTSGNYLTKFMEGGENLRHHDNWSRDVKYQVNWFGGSPDPSRKPELPRGSSNQAYRDIKQDDDGYNAHTSGAYDILVQNNYAEYGNTLAWGNKGRQVVIDGNIARFISDYAYGSEGGENIVFSNNISINSTAGGIVSMYWGEKLLITGNLIITRHEPWDPEWSWWDTPAKYLGPFVRLHHGPSNPEDLYGAGSVQITGNQFVSELSGRSVAVTIQEGRDVMISGNKFVNGRIDKVNEGRLTVMNNEFVSRLPFADAIMNIKGRADAVFIQGNVLRREPPVTQPADDARKSAEAAVVPGILFTEDEDGKSTDTAAKTDSPAIVFQVSGPFFGQVQGNFVQGWQDMLAMQPVARFREQTGLIVTGNTTDGRLDVPFDGGDPARLIFKNNATIPAGLAP